MNKETKINIVLAALLIIGGVVFAVISWNILPDTVQAQFGGVLNSGATFPKLFAVLIPFGITSLFAVYGITYRKQMLISFIGYAMNILFWLSNV